MKIAFALLPHLLSASWALATGALTLAIPSSSFTSFGKHITSILEGWKYSNLAD